MNYSPEILNIVQVAAEQYPQVDEACNKAIAQVRKSKSFEKFVDTLIDDAIRSLVYSARHRINRSLTAPPAPKVVVGKSSAVRKTTSQYFAMCIGGTTLGRMTRDQLAEAAVAERERANGHMFNARLCERLAAIVPENKTVEQSIDPGTMKRIWVNAAWDD